jgi:hypothetical protein
LIEREECNVQKKGGKKKGKYGEERMKKKKKGKLNGQRDLRLNRDSEKEGGI